MQNEANSWSVQVVQESLKGENSWALQAECSCHEPDSQLSAATTTTINQEKTKRPGTGTKCMRDLCFQLCLKCHKKENSKQTSTGLGNKSWSRLRVKHHLRNVKTAVGIPCFFVTLLFIYLVVFRGNLLTGWLILVNFQHIGVFTILQYSTHFYKFAWNYNIFCTRWHYQCFCIHFS